VPKTATTLAPVELEPVHLDDVVERLRAVDSDLRKLAGTLELAHDQGDEFARELVLDLAAGWLWKVAVELEMAHCDLTRYAGSTPALA